MALGSKYVGRDKCVSVLLERNSRDKIGRFREYRGFMREEWIGVGLEYGRHIFTEDKEKSRNTGRKETYFDRG